MFIISNVIGFVNTQPAEYSGEKKRCELCIAFGASALSL
jgi:hypothetical protein